MIQETLLQMGFWTAWLVIPALFELLVALWGWWHIHFKPVAVPSGEVPGRMPQVTIILPVYNAAGTLAACLRSIARCDYPNELITVICANNQSTDDSWRVYQTMQKELRNLRLQWLEGPQRGKAQALNMAIYASSGDYVVTMDSTGLLGKHALKNFIHNFMLDPAVQAQTGTVLCNRKLIEADRHHRWMHHSEYLAHAIAFLAGRTAESQTDQLITLSGALAAFRRSALMQSRMYSVETVGVATDMAFQIRYYLKGKVILCPTAVFYAPPAPNWAALNAKYQRWQRGEIEVIRAFLATKLSLTGLFANFLVRRLLLEYTMALLKVGWLVMGGLLLGLGYPGQLVGLSFAFVYLLYLWIAGLNLSNVLFYLRFDKTERNYCDRHWWTFFTLPLYQLVTDLFRLSGLINGLSPAAPAKKVPANWRKRGQKRS